MLPTCCMQQLHQPDLDTTLLRSQATRRLRQELTQAIISELLWTPRPTGAAVTITYTQTLDYVMRHTVNLPYCSPRQQARPALHKGAPHSCTHAPHHSCTGCPHTCRHSICSRPTKNAALPQKQLCCQCCWQDIKKTTSLLDPDATRPTQSDVLIGHAHFS